MTANIKRYLSAKLDRDLTNDELGSYVGLKARRFGDLLNRGELDVAQAAAILRGVGLPEAQVVTALIDLDYFEAGAVAEGAAEAGGPDFTQTRTRKEVGRKKWTPRQVRDDYQKPL